MHVMGSVSPANESERFSFQEKDVAIAVAMSPPSPSTFSEIKETKIRLPDPPPPLPIPPPPPPLLPLAPGLGDPTLGLKKKRRVRSFFWKTIPVEQVKGRANLWTQGQVQQHFQIDVQKIEELFGQNDRQTDVSGTRGGRTRASFREIKEEVSILDSKRAMNIAIFLKQFKRSNQAIVDDIHHGNSVSFGAELLRELLKLLPETEEEKKLKAYQGDISKLPLPDSFMYLLIQEPSYSVRIESMLLKEEFRTACEAMKQEIKILRSATRELMCCEELHAVLHLVLQAGNILNAGGYAGNAVGFKLSSLLSLADTKANKPGMNLLHFVALEAQKKDEKLLQFPLKLSDVQAASRIPLETLDADLQLLTSRTCSVEENIQKDTELLQQLDSFLQGATLSLRSLRGSRQQLKKEGSELIDFFCEDRDTFRLDECFRIFHSFCTRFSQAVKENREREVKEAARRQRLQEEEQKRHSWAGGEEVDGAFGLRCSSEADMSAIMSLYDETGLLVERPLLKSRPRSPLNSYHSPRGQQRSRYSPSNSPSIAAERELSNLLGMSSDHKVVRQRGSGDARTAFPSKPLKNPENCTTATDLSHDDAQTQRNIFNNANKVTVKATSYSDQQSDHNNGGNTQLSLGFSSQATLLHPQTYSGLSRGTDSTDEVFSRQIACTDEKVEHTTAAKGNMPVVLEKCTLVPELKAFDTVTALSSHNEVQCTSHPQQDLVITDLEGEVDDTSQEGRVQNNSQETENEEKPDVHPTRSSSQREEHEEQDKVIVWCVTGVCEAAGECAHARTDKHLCEGDSQGGKQKTSTASANQNPSEPQQDSERSVPLPISSQPVPCKDSSLPVSSPKIHPAGSVAPALTADASEEDPESASQGKEEEGATDQRSDVAPEHSTDDRSKNQVPSHQSKEVSSTDAKAKPSMSSRLSTKNFPTSKPRVAGVKPPAPNATSSANRSKSVRTLTNSESQDMRRVVPISRTGRGAPPTNKQTEKPSAQNRSSAKSPASSSLTISNLSSASLRRGARPATAPSSRRSSNNRMPDSKEPKDQKVPGIQGSVQEQKQDWQRKPATRKALTKPKAQTEEKMCLSKLRALNQGGGGGSISAPATPLHKAKIPSTPLPGFARSTASSSFRRTNTTLAPSHSLSTGSPKSSPKDSSRSTPSATASSTFTRTGSLRVTTSSKSPDLLNVPSPSPLRRSQSIRSSAHSLASPKGHRRNDSGSFSDKSNQSRDSGKSTKPSWR
ncbi:uncharacterized protein [Leuresthes tenuis]|uniref:uncharacterized protein n=1 Tax=Leuresthes tenuis TaxID=355514 RepID=UPI003B505C3C